MEKIRITSMMLITKMKTKFFLLASLAFVMNGMMTSCGGDDDDPTKPVTSVTPVTPSDNNNNEGTTSGIEAVDLGLSVKWANVNLGASKMEEYGDLYAYGELKTKSTYTASNYKFYHNKYTDKDGVSIDTIYYDPIGKEVSIEISGNYYDTYDIANTEYDVAQKKLGGKWRLPTYKEIQELQNNCEWKWGSVNDKYGYKITGKNGNYIFLPSAGFGTNKGREYGGSSGNYLSSTLIDKQHNGQDPDFSCFYSIDFSKTEIWYGSHGRTWGYSVRAVSE